MGDIIIHMRLSQQTHAKYMRKWRRNPGRREEAADYLRSYRAGMHLYTHDTEQWDGLLAFARRPPVRVLPPVEHAGLEI